MSSFPRIRSRLLGAIVVAFLIAAPLTTLPAQKGSKASSAVLAAGRRLFGANCAVCHDSTGQGGEGPKLRGIGLSETQIADIIGAGFKGQMPSFKSRLKPAERKSIAGYVKSLK